MFGQDQPSETQNDILRLYDRNPDMSAKAIARRCGCSESYVYETVNKYRDGFGSSSGFL